MQFLCAALCILLAPLAVAGPLNPPAGPITSAPGPEPRIAVSATNTPGTTTCLFRITQPGSYYLTGNITGVSIKSGIEIGASGVTLDLNGFDLVGVPGAGSGITTVGSLVSVVIVNGSVRTWGGNGIAANATGTVIRDIRAISNASSGIVTGAAASVSNCTARLNGSIGIFCGDRCSLLNCTSSGNTGTGLFAGSTSTLLNCTSTSNTSSGIGAGNACTITNCTADGNAGTGFQLSFLTSLTACVATRNASGITTASSCIITNCTASENTVDGIKVQFNSVVRGNTCSLNGSSATPGAGISVANSRNRIEENNCPANYTGILVSGPGNIVLSNSCSASSNVNYSIVSNNRYGPIIDLTALGSPAVSGNAAATTLSSTDAHANYAY